MAGDDVSVGSDLAAWPVERSGWAGEAGGEWVLNQILKAPVAETHGADRHERSEERPGYRNDYRPRTLYTRVWPVTLQVPQMR